jgi:putative glutamine amidotransferase
MIMKKMYLVFGIIFLTFSVFAQNFLTSGYDPGKRYVLLCDPTVSRISTIGYLTENRIFRVKDDVEFIGLYFEDQNYDFGKTKAYIEKNKLGRFHLQEIKGDIPETELFRENELTTQLKNAFEHSVGVIFFGGPDIPPSVYGEENSRSEVTDPQRHYYETTFLFHLLGGFQNENFSPFLEERPDYVVTGFCLGMQTMNIATGGTLVQDIPEEIYSADNAGETVKLDRNNLHRNYWQELVEDSLLMGINLHPIQFTGNAFFGKKVKTRTQAKPKIYSSHHQAAEKIGKNLEVTALSEDGKVIEGLAHSKYPNVFAVQFHPEVPALYENTEKLKFAPEDEPKTLHEIIGKDGVRFHKAYWKHISKVIQKVN